MGQVAMFAKLLMPNSHRVLCIPCELKVAFSMYPSRVLFPIDNKMIYFSENNCTLA